MKQQDRAQEGRLCVLKFGSSVLGAESDYPAAALEVYRHVREGEKVVAVVSALAGETDALLDQAARVGGEPAAGLVARLARVGELHSAALMALALSRVGVRACTLDPHEMGLVAEGAPLDANLTGLDAAAVRAMLKDHDVVVVPGFTAGHAEHGVVTLGRGGTDLSAVFFAARLDAHRVRLIKDVDGVYAEDPAVNPKAERYAEIGYDAAAEVSAGLVQEKAIRRAKTENVLIEVAALGAAEATVISRVRSRTSLPLKGTKLRVALLGCGAVGAGVLHYLEGRPDLFEVNPVLVRDCGLRGRDARFTSEIDRALSGNPDLVVELIGGIDETAALLRSALRAGRHVVTANKAALAEHFDALHGCAEAGGAMLAYSAAVGGGAPILEALDQVKGEVTGLEGVMNGTCNFLLGKLAEGWSFDEAVRKARELGFAEDDPSADIEGHDAANKLSLLVRRAFGVALAPARIARQSLRTVSPEQLRSATDAGRVMKQVGRCALLPDGSIAAEVKVEALPVSHVLAGARNEENRFLIRCEDGRTRHVHGKGAGRWPTATAVFADVMDIQRALLARTVLESAPSSPLRLSA